MLALCRALSVREIRKHPARSSLIAASFALGVIAWTTTWSLNRALDEALRDVATPSASADLYVSNGDAGMPRTLLSRVAGVAGVRSARPVVIERIRVTGRRTAPAVLLGVDLSAYGDGSDVGVTVMPAAKAAFLRGMLFRQNPVFLGARLREQIDPEADAFTATVAGKTRSLKSVGTLEPDGILSALGGAIVLTEDRLAAALAGHPGQISRIDVGIAPGADARIIRDRIAAEIGGRAEVMTPERQDGRVRQSLGALRVGFALCGTGALVLALFLVTNVLGVSIAERRKTIGLLRSLGSTTGQVRAEVLGESLILGAIGSAIGVPLGFAVAALALGPMLRALGDVFVPLQSGGITFDPTLAAGGVGAGLVTSLLASWGPASRASATSPTQAMRSGAAETAIPSRHRAIMAITLTASALVVFLSLGIVAEAARVYLTLVLALLAAIVCIPLTVAPLARLLRPLAERVAGIAGRLAIDSLIRSPARAGPVIAGLAGAVALMIQTGGVIQGNESAVRSWVDGCITGDLFLTSGGPMSASGRTTPMDESLVAEIAATLPGATVVPMRFRHLDWAWRGEPTRILMLALDAPAYCEMGERRRPPLRDLPLYRLLREPGTALVSENFAALNRVRPGATIALPGAEGPVSVRVVGTIVDFSNNRGTIVVDRRGVGRSFMTSAVDVFAVGLPPGSDPEAARLAVSRSPWAASNAVEAMTRRALRGHILGMIRRLYGVAYVQEVVAATVAALGVSASMLIGVVQRRRELGLLRALGATSRQVFLTVIAEAAAMAVIGVALGIALGLALEWYVLRVVLLLETGFDFPVRLPWADVAMVAAIVVAAAILAGVAPAASASRLGAGVGLARD